MISCVDFSNKLSQLQFDTAIGVPDSTFKGLISYFSSQDVFRNIIASNECEAIGIGAGYYLANKKPAMVYMQNSGFCKTLNPYTSMLSADVYSVPTLMLVGWRGEPGKKDEPQHKMMGRIMIDLFKVMELEYAILDESIWQEQLEIAREYMEIHERPYVIAIPKGLFDDFKMPDTGASIDKKTHMLREEAVNVMVDHMSEESVIISTTGKTSRELFEIREQREQSHYTDFYTVGSMGCASSIAFGIGLADSQKNVFILDGDGAALMQLGAFATLGHYRNPRIKHIILDNNAHESTGGQPTVSDTVDFPAIARACGYQYVQCVDNKEDLKQALIGLEDNGKLSLLVVKVKKGARKDLGRPTTTPKENRDGFIQNFKAG
jgi:phosphonopyruvate decarboxylase